MLVPLTKIYSTEIDIYNISHFLLSPNQNQYIKDREYFRYSWINSNFPVIPPFQRLLNRSDITSIMTQILTFLITSWDFFYCVLCRYHYCPDHDYSQHHSPEISAKGLLCHSNGSLRICLLHLCVFCFGGVWHPALFCQQSETKQGQRQKEEKPCMYHFPSGQANSLWGKVIGFGLLLDWLAYTVVQHIELHDEKRISELSTRK